MGSIVGIVVAGLLASAPEDGVLEMSARLPAAGTVRVRAATLGFADWQVGTARTSVQRSLTDELSAGAETEWLPDRPAAAVNLRWQALSQQRAPVDLVASVRVRSLGNEGVGGALEARVAAARSFGRLELLSNVAVAAGFAGREDVDAEGVLSASWRFGRGLRAGLLARANGELVDRLHTLEDEGRPVGFLAGPSLSLRLGRVEVQALAGALSPRGTAAPGAAIAANASLDW